MLACCFDVVGGYEAFEKWVKSSPKRLDPFYTKMWIRLLPMNVGTEGHKKMVYHSLAEVREALAKACMTLELLQRLKQEDADDGTDRACREASGKAGISLELLEKLLKMEAEESKPHEHVRVD